MGQLNYAKFGLDPTTIDPITQKPIYTTDYGMNVNLPFSPTLNTTNVGQGIPTSLYYAQGSVSLLINPKTNLRLELGGLFRDEKNSLGSSKTAFVTFGIRSSFRGMYSDF
jgi:hypothetical protein